MLDRAIIRDWGSREVSRRPMVKFAVEQCRRGRSSGLIVDGGTVQQWQVRQWQVQQWQVRQRREHFWPAGGELSGRQWWWRTESCERGPVNGGRERRQRRRGRAVRGTSGEGG
jgi:hypothetical protein